MPADNSTIYDLFIIGGGINGCGLARDAAGRGFRTGLAEMGDLASGTSSASTKLIHGGLRYLEYYAFHLVREALREREILWRMAPHIIRPLRFLLPLRPGLRPAWRLRAGLFIYDHLGGRRELPKSATADFSGAYGAPLKNIRRYGFEYSDARVDDSRLVLLNARHAARLGAAIWPRTKVLAITAAGDCWRVKLRRAQTGEDYAIRARFVANMSGPWVNQVTQQALGLAGRPLRLVQGSHIIVPALYRHDRAYIFQGADGRIIFAIPYQQDWTLIGTTDTDYQGDPAKAQITAAETAYLCAAAGSYFQQPIREEQIVWSYAGIRPLDDGGSGKAQAASRDYRLQMVNPAGTPPLLNAYGGKITTYRKLAEEAMGFIERALGARGRAWTANVPLPGGDFPHNNIAGLEAALAQALPALNKPTIARLAAAYGTEAAAIFAHGRQPPGRHFGHGLYEAELRFLCEQEWAETADDILWRRSKLGLRFSPLERAALAAWLAKEQERPGAAAPAGRPRRRRQKTGNTAITEEET